MLYPTRGGLSHARRGSRGCADGLCPIQDSLLCDLSPWRLGLALKGQFWLTKQNIFTENCLRQRNPQDPLISLISLATVDLSLLVNCFEFPVKDLSGKIKLSFFFNHQLKQLVVCSQLAVNF